MHTLYSIVYSKFQQAIQKAFPELAADALSVEVTQSTQKQFGDYQCNSAMKLASIVKKSPRAVAEKLLEFIDVNEGVFQKVEIAGPGFINIWFQPEFLSAHVDVLVRDVHLGIDPPEDYKRIIIDFSSPNVAKEMHVGHLRSTVIGDCLARLFEFLGYDVVRHNHLGDWGTAFGMLIAYIKENEPDVFTGIQKTDLTHLMQWYKLSKKQFDEDPAFKRRSQLEVVALQSGQPQAMVAWEMICSVSRKAYQEIYDLLQVKIIERGESYYNPYLPEIVADLERKGLVEISDGAKCIFLEGFQNRDGDRLPLMIQKSDGGYNYDTTDMATIYHRITQEKGERLIYVTDAGQATHFQMIFQAAEKAGYLDRSKVRVDHVPFGLVLGPDGKKFRTRSGETEKLIDLIRTAIEKSKEILTNRNPDIEASEKELIAETLGIAAIKYADLSNHRMSDYTFNYEKMLRFEGNTAAFLMYAYVRICGIKRKINQDINDLFENTRISLEEPAEKDLGLHLLRFQETLEMISNDLLPNRLTDYLYNLADKFNVFFRDCRVEGSPKQNERLLLCEATARVLKIGLYILGINTIEKM